MNREEGIHGSQGEEVEIEKEGQEVGSKKEGGCEALRAEEKIRREEKGGCAEEICCQKEICAQEIRAGEVGRAEGACASIASSAVGCAEPDHPSPRSEKHTPELQT